MLKINLNKNEYKYICHQLSLPEELHKLIISSEKHGNEYIIYIPLDQADKIRDFCTEKLDLIGFDEQYKPTAEGIILESLIDKFFI
jgi:hypothetical protein